MRRILPALVIAIVAIGCSAQSTVTTTTAPPPDASITTGPSPRMLRIAALGDSYTAGTAIGTGRWPDQLADRITTSGDDVTLTVIAGEGWNTKRLSREFSRSGVAETHDVVILAIGANDVVLNFGEENFVEGLELLAGQIAEISDSETQRLVLSIPDFRASPWGQERLDRDYPIERYNEILEAYATDLGAVFVDITTTSAAGLEDPELIAGDDLHFSAEMYARWVDAIAPRILDR